MLITHKHETCDKASRHCFALKGHKPKWLATIGPGEKRLNQGNEPCIHSLDLFLVYLLLQTKFIQIIADIDEMSSTITSSFTDSAYVNVRVFHLYLSLPECNSSLSVCY